MDGENAVAAEVLPPISPPPHLFRPYLLQPHPQLLDERVLAPTRRLQHLAPGLQLLGSSLCSCLGRCPAPAWQEGLQLLHLALKLPVEEKGRTYVVEKEGAG